MKKLFLLMLAIALVMSLVACGGSVTPTATPTPTPTDATSPATPDSASGTTSSPTALPEKTPESTVGPDSELVVVPLNDISIKLPKDAKGKIEDNMITAVIAISEDVNVVAIIQSSDKASDSNDQFLNSADAVFGIATASFGAAEYDEKWQVDLGTLEALKFEFESGGDSPNHMFMVAFVYKERIYSLFVGASPEYPDLGAVTDDIVSTIEFN